MGLKDIYKKFSKKICLKDYITNRVKIRLNHAVDKDVQSMLIPLNLMQAIMFLPKYSIKNNFITPNRRAAKFLSLFWTILCIIPFISRCIIRLEFHPRLFNLFMSSLSLFFDVFFYSFSFVVIYILNTIHAKINISIVLTFQKVHRFLNNKDIIKTCVKWNWIAVILILSYNLQVLVIKILWRSGWVFICDLIIFCFDVNMIYAIRLMGCLETYVASTYNEVFKRGNHNNENEHIWKFRVYNQILKCYNAFKIAFQPLVLIHTLETCIHTLIDVQFVITIASNEAHIPLVLIFNLQCILKNLYLQMLFSWRCEMFYSALNLFQDSCTLILSKNCSGQELPKDEDKSFLDPVLQRHLKSRSLDNRQGIRLDVPTASKDGATVKPFFPAAFATNLTANTLEILEGTLTMRRSATHVTKLNTRLIESIPGGDTAFMSRMMAMGANANATCRLNHVSACHIAAMHDHDALDLLLRSGADSSRSDKQGRTPLHLAAWVGTVRQIALLLNFPEALKKSVGDHVVLSPETVEEVKKHSLPVNKLTNVPCRLNVESTLPGDWSDGMEHNCRIIKEILPLFQQGWTALHAASARAQHHCVQLLLAAGADVSALDLLCRTPLDVAGCANCSGHEIDVNNFNETVKFLLKAGGKFTRCYHKNYPLDTPLHTAVELGSEAAVEQMLQDGASASVWNSRGLTAMHMCVEKRNKELLQLLANHKCGNEDPYLATVDVKDRTGFTVLCAAVKAEWIEGVCIALGAGASITMKANEESPIHIAAQSGNIDILQEILTVAKYNSTIDFRNEKGETALFKAISNNQLDSLKLLLEAGSSIEVEISNKANVLHVAAKHGSKDVLKHLLEYNSNITAKLINKFDSMGPPLFYTVMNNHLICAELLICKGAQVNAFLECNNLIDTDILTWTSLLHLAARHNHYKIAEIIIKHDSETIHATDSAGRTPLHEACCHGNREMIVLLLRKGADLSGAGRNGLSKTKLPPIDILMNNLSKPTEFMQKIFDSYISSQGVSLQESNCEVVVDYGVLVPNKENMKRMRVIKALINTGNRYDQHRLLLHPLVQSFLYLKWRSLLSFFYSILILHVCFVLSLNVYAISVFYYKDKSKDVPFILRSSVWIHMIYLTVCLTTIQEIIFIKIKSKRYFLCLETWLKCWSIMLAVFLPRVVSWDTESSAEWARLIATVALLLSWFEMMFLLSRFPNWGYYVLMFGKVANKVFKILVSFVFLIFGFSVSFMIQFRAKPPFEGPWSAFITTLVMMTSEFDYNQTLSAVDASASIITLRLIFVSFLILVSIVLMNLLVGVAVNDVNNLEIIGNIKRLEKQVEFITSLEDIVCNKFIKQILPKSLYKRWLKNIKWENVIVLRPREATCSNCNRLPARLREAIFEKAQLQKTQSDDQQGTMLYQMKLDEMYKVIVQKDGTGSSKPGGPDNALNKIIEDVNKIRGDIEVIKNFIVTTKHRSFSSNKSAPLLVVTNNN